jgi:hypothetical protein
MIMEIKYRRDLINLLREFKLPLEVAEIGVAEGLFSRDMLMWGIDRLYCIDSYRQIHGTTGDGNFPDSWHQTNSSKSKELLRPWLGKVTWLEGLSSEMAIYVPDQSLGLLYIDADHSYEGVMQDLERYYSKVVPGGIIAGHDYLNNAYGVREAVGDFCIKYHHTVKCISEDKREDAGFWFQKIENYDAGYSFQETNTH